MSRSHGMASHPIMIIHHARILHVYGKTALVYVRDAIGASEFNIMLLIILCTIRIQLHVYIHM